MVAVERDCKSMIKKGSEAGAGSFSASSRRYNDLDYLREGQQYVII
jgi:hypothetical protein